ncbi:hypothetical protein [Brasilonema sp. UFV-L1]|uniref:hypothetical protein n=1 Tax=Brasilonema sp. UFV-L1 TaxID=2234130 RepID=UPI00145F3500|nr:hypothetical protein [Brasilonema sp. UFV-L1]
MNEDYRSFWASVTLTAILGVYLGVKGAIALWAFSPVLAIGLIAISFISAQYIVTSIR